MNIIQSKMEKEREVNYDILRVLSMFAVIMLHILTKVENMDVTAIWEKYDVGIRALCSLGVPSFVMLSGAFTLGNFRQENILKFYQKIFTNILLPMLLASGVYMLYDSLYLIRNGSNILSALINEGMKLLHGKPYYHLWYMYMILPLFLITPFIAYIRESIGEGYLAFGILLIVIGITIGSLYSSEYEWGINSFKYIGYYVLGDVCHHCFCSKKRIRKAVFMIGVAMMFVAAITCIRIYEIVNRVQVFPMNIFSEANPFIIGGTIALFVGFGLIRCNETNLISKISKQSWWIYLVHAFVIELLVKLLNMAGIWQCFSLMQLGFLTLLGFILSVVFSYIFSCICAWCYDGCLVHLHECLIRRKSLDEDISL